MNYRYNEKTNERDIYDGLVSKYSFMYKDKFMVFLEVTTKKGIITRFEYGFDFAQNLDKIKNQVIKNGFVFDSRLTKVFIKLGFNYCLVFTKKPNYNFTIYHEKKFTVSKS